MSDRHNEEAFQPKPYAFVPLSQRVERRPPQGHHTYTQGSLSGTIDGVIVAQSVVHVASGLLRHDPKNRQYPLVKAHFRSNDKIAIPATSLKGCIRSIVEAISPSAVTVTRARPLPNESELSRSVEKLDVAQRIFGAQGYLGNISFGDAVLQGNTTVVQLTPQLFRPRPESSDTYFDGTRPKGRKFYMHGQLVEGNLPLEACAIGSRFTFTAHFENLTKGELGLLLCALGLGKPKLWPKLGGGKPACLGTVEVMEMRVETIDVQAAYKDFDLEPTIQQDLEPLIQAATTEMLLDAQRLAQLAEVLQWPRPDRDCAGGVY